MNKNNKSQQKSGKSIAKLRKSSYFRVVVKPGKIGSTKVNGDKNK